MLGSSTDWIAIAPAGSQATDVYEWAYTGGKTSGQQSFASLGAGSYVARAFFSSSYTIAAESPAFTVAYGGAAVVSTDAGTYTGTDSIVVSFSGLSGSFKDWVSIEIAGRSPTAAVVHWSYTGGGTTGTTTLPPVRVTGSYVARAYNNNGTTVVAESTPFTVTGEATTASSDRATYTTSTPITASYSGLLGISTDWVALAPAGAPASSFTAWSYTGGVASGQHAFAPLASGTYVVRVFFANSYTIAAESAPFTVIDPGEVVLQPATRVVSPALRAALKSYDPSTGQMQFVGSQDLLGALSVGDVLVSEPSEAAPFGYLRRVTDVAASEAGVVLHTVPARLDEAIRNAPLTQATVVMQPGASNAVLVPGPFFLPSSAPTSAAGAGVGGAVTLNKEFHEGGVDLSLSGSGTAWAGLSVGAGVDVWCEFDGDPCFQFTAEAGLVDEATFTIDARFTGHFEKTLNVFHQDYEAITFWIGPVPVVLTPSIDIDLEFNGDANGHFEYAASANGPEYNVSAHWDSSNGFSTGKHSKAADFTAGLVDFTSELDVHAKLPIKARLLLYDAAGVHATLTAGLDGRFHVPHKPRWSVDGSFEASIGVEASLPVIGDLGSYDMTLFDERFALLESPPTHPRIAIELPVANQQISLTWPEFGVVPLRATTDDDQDGPGCCTVQWQLLDGTPLATGADAVSPALPHPGHFEIVAVATNSENLSTTSAAVPIDVTLPPVGARIVLPGAACESKIYTNLPTRLLGRDGQYLGNFPYSCTWFSDNAADLPQFPPAQELATPGSPPDPRGCELETFFPTPGVRTLTLRVEPVFPEVTIGAATDTTKTIRVFDPPAGPVPVLAAPGPAACENIPLDAVEGSTVAWVEAIGGADVSRIDWTWQPLSCPTAATLPVHPIGSCFPGFCHYAINGVDVLQATPPGCGPGDPTNFAGLFGVVTITATDSGGLQNSTLFYIELSHQTIR